VAVCFKINSTVKFHGCVVEVLHARRGADDWKSKGFSDIQGRGAISVGCLNHANLERCDARRVDKVADEAGSEGGDFVAIEESESPITVIEVID